ncbi:hypothetical protein ACF0H5_018083 [Mactra antiquata]
MRPSNVGYIVGIMALFGLIYFIYRNQTKPLSAPDLYIRAPEGKLTQDELRSVFDETRKTVVHPQAFDPMVIPITRNSSFDYKAAMKKLNDAKVDQDDPRLIKLIRDYYIEAPSTEPYNLLNPERMEYSNGQTPFIDSRLNYMEGGFYIECGALNGEKGSNTLFFEKVRKWNGLLIEADPETYADLKSKHRKAFTMNACLNPKPYPAMMTFNRAFNRGRVVHDQEAKDWIKQQHIAKDEIQIQCFPLYSILLALNQLTVDFFSLDVEGEEYNVLQTIPFDKVNIKMMTVEFVHDKGSSAPLKTYVENKGYESMLQVSRWDGGVNDIIFRKKV